MSTIKQHPSVRVSSFIENQLTVVTLATELNGAPVVVRGVARLAPGDKFDKTVGFEMAYGRALAKLAKRALKQSWGSVDHRDKMKEQNKARQDAQNQPPQTTPHGRDLVLLNRDLATQS